MTSSGANETKKRASVPSSLLKRRPRRDGDDDESTPAGVARLLSFTEFASRCEIVDINNNASASSSVSSSSKLSLEDVDFSSAVATPSDLYGAYLGLMRSGLWLECLPRIELHAHHQKPLSCLKCTPNPRPAAKRNGTVPRTARQKTKAYAFALNRGVIDEEFLEIVANRDGLDRLAASAAVEKVEKVEGEGGEKKALERTTTRERTEHKEEEEEKQETNDKKDEHESIIVVTIDSDGTTTAMRVSRDFVEPDELIRKDEDDRENDGEGDDVFFGDNDDQDNGGGGRKNVLGGATKNLAFSSGSEGDDEDDDYGEVSGEEE
jgi:hypothetical protein